MGHTGSPGGHWLIFVSLPMVQGTHSSSAGLWQWPWLLAAPGPPCKEPISWVKPLEFAPSFVSSPVFLKCPVLPYPRCRIHPLNSFSGVFLDGWLLLALYHFLGWNAVEQMPLSTVEGKAAANTQTSLLVCYGSLRMGSGGSAENQD